MKRLRYQIVAFTATRMVFHTMIRMVYPFLPAIGRGLGVDLASLSLALTARSLVGMFGSLLAFTADRFGRKTGMLTGLGVFVLGLGVVIIWPTYPGFFAALILTLAGNLMFIPSMQAYLGDRIPYQRRGFVLALTEMSWSTAFIFGVPVVGWLIGRYGWQSPFPVLLGATLVCLAWLTWLVPSDRPEVHNQPDLWISLRRVLGYRPALAGLALGVLISTANETVNLVFGVWLEEAFSLKIMALGAASVVIGLSELTGEGLTAAFTDRVGKPWAVIIGLLLNACAVLVLPFIGRSLPGALAGLFFFYLSFEFALVSLLPLMTELLPSARATLMAANIAAFALGRALGALLASPLYDFSFYANVGVAAVLDLLALGALLLLRKGSGIQH